MIYLVAVWSVLLAHAPPAAAQQPGLGRIEGRVVDAQGPVFSAEVQLLEGTPAPGVSAPVRARAETDRDGAFELQAVAGRYTLIVRRLGYNEAREPVVIAAGQVTRTEVTLTEQAIVLEGVGVQAERSRERRRFEETAGITVREISQEELKLVPGFAEADPIRAVEVLPGVVSTSDFSSSFHVRGGSADQNLILLDGTPIFSPFHLGGFFSVFNADMVDRAELASGGFPARYGGRVSSVLTVESDPGEGRFGVDAGVSLLATRVAVEGGLPVGARQSLGVSDVRWRVSARRSYIDALLAPITQFPYHLQDFQAVAEVGIGARDRVRFTAYTGDDVLRLTQLENDFPLRIDWNWGNDIAGLRWTRELDAGRWVTAASYSRFGTGLTFPDFGDTDFSSAVDQKVVRSDLELEPTPGLKLSTGAEFESMSYDNLAQSGGTVFQQGLGDGRRLGVHFGLDGGTPGRWLVEAGVRLDRWMPDPGAAVNTWSPRASAKWFFANGRAALKASAGRYTQFLHSVRDEELPLGLDVWVLSGDRAPAVVSDQLQFGIEAFPDDVWTFTLEGYLRDFEGVVTLNNADDPNDPLDDLLAGTGRSWGADLFVRRAQGAVSGWLSLSFLRAERTFPDFLSPEFAGPSATAPTVTYAPIFDRRIDADLVLRFPGPWGWTAGARLNVGTGTPYTRPVAAYSSYQPRILGGAGGFEWGGADDEAEGDDDGGGFGGTAVLLGERNAERYPLYHRLDLSLRRDIERSWGTLTPHIDILNVYNRRNVLFYFFDYESSPATRSGISMFPLLPTIGLEVRF